MEELVNSVAPFKGDLGTRGYPDMDCPVDNLEQITDTQKQAPLSQGLGTLEKSLVS